MKVVSVYPKKDEKNILESAINLLTGMSLFATDKAIIQYANQLEIQNKPIEILKEKGFDSNRKIKSIIIKLNNQLQLFTIGAPEELFNLTSTDTSNYQSELTIETGKGRRVIGVATKVISISDQDKDFSILEKEMTILGLISIEDSPRVGVKEALDLAQTAGIRTIMVTGDHPQTALYIAKTVGIVSDRAIIGSELDAISDQELQVLVNKVSVFARCTPEHKYRLLKALQANGEIVAVTGDGVNDTLALKGANIGVAMGIKGTDAAKEAADVVLADDNYSTLSYAIFEGRKLYDNLQKGVSYYLSAKMALVLVFLLPVLINIPFPFAPIQIIILEMFMDLAASTGFMAEPAEKTIYKKLSKDKPEKFLSKRVVINIIVSAFSLFAAVMIPYFYALSQNLSVAQAQTIAFSGWMIGHIFLAFVSRSRKEPLCSLGVFSNKVMSIWAICAFGFLLLAITIPRFNFLLKLENISLRQLGLVFIISFVVIFWKEVVKTLVYFRR
jgi:Ca2+-transporting ATPase